jgi:pimeloyl-ACP methyl ester carboxylesterase
MKAQPIGRAWLLTLATLGSPAWATSVVEKRVTVAPHVQLHSIEAGRAIGLPTIVFIPGWSTSADIWRSQIDRFARKYRVISFDPRSQGASTITTSGNTPEQRAADLRMLIASTNVRRPVLVAWSQAVQDVAAYVLRYGTGNLSGIVLVDAAVADGSKAIAERPQQSADEFRLFAVYQSDQRAYLRGMFAAIISKPQRQGVVDRAIATAMKTPPSIGIAMLVSDMFGPDRTAALARMACPVLIIAAGSSSELDRQKAEAATELPNAQFIQIDDSGHAVFLDQPDRFAWVLADFVEHLR